MCDAMMYDTGVEELQREIRNLKLLLIDKEQQLRDLQKSNGDGANPYTNYFTSSELTRYSRQIIMPDFQCSGQLRLKQSSVLVVGLGGLGCPAALYLSAAGVGELILMDYDDVELTNLHRQILHGSSDIGAPKVISAETTLKHINSNVKIHCIRELATAKSLTNFLNLYKCDLILDCSDNAPTRYLLNDICIKYNIPLVSGSALKCEGQLTIYNYKDGPCYRCLFPKPPPPSVMTSCGDEGVLGAVTGVIGSLQALEAIKIILNKDDVLSGKLLIFDGYRTMFRVAKLRNRNIDCDGCGTGSRIDVMHYDYESFCRVAACDKVQDINVLDPRENIDAAMLKETVKHHCVIDVRPRTEYEMCNIPNTINIPYAELLRNNNDALQMMNTLLRDHEKVYFLCRRGNDSQRVIQMIKQNYTLDNNCALYNIEGGLLAFHKHADRRFPLY